MKYRILYSTASLIVVFIVASAFHSVHNNTCDAPLIGSGYTGAPGDKDCSLCHSGSVNSGPGSISFDIGTGISEYTPGQTYTATIKINQTGIDKFGFQLLVLKDSDDSFVGSYNLTDIPNTRMINGAGGKKYVGSTACGSDAMTTDSIEWSLEWIAPTVNEGNITLYLATIATNHNHSASGDYSYTQAIKLSSSVATGISAYSALEKSFNVFPNPASTEFQINYSLEERSFVEISVLDLKGQQIDMIVSGEKSSGNHKHIIDLSRGNYSNGLYIMKVNVDGDVFTKKLNVVK